MEYQFVEFNRFANSPIVNYKWEYYKLLFNMMWGVKTPKESKTKIEEQKAGVNIENPKILNSKLFHY